MDRCDSQRIYPRNNNALGFIHGKVYRSRDQIMRLVTSRRRETESKEEKVAPPMVRQVAQPIS
jgi:hypothetical protein